MLLTFRELQRQVQAKLQNTDTSVTAANDLLPKIKDWINIRYMRIYRSFFWEESIDNYDLTIVASTEEYAFDRDVGEIIGIFDKTNAKTIEQDTILGHMRYKANSLDKTGNIVTDNPTRWRPTGVFTVKNAIAASAEKIRCVSDDAADVSPESVRITGLVSSVEIGNDITLTGTSTADSTDDFDATQKINVSVGTTDGTRKGTAGKITVSGATSGTVFAVISPFESAHKYQWFKVSPKPKSSGTQAVWEIWYQKAFRNLNENNDIPIFDCSAEIAQGAFADALREDGLEQEANVAEQIFVTMVGELQAVKKNHTFADQFRPVSGPINRFTSDNYSWVV